MTSTASLPVLTVGAWCDRWYRLDPNREDPNGRQSLFDAGLAEADVAVFEAAVLPRADLRHPAQAFVGMLLYLGSRNPALTMPAALGWSVVGCLVHRQVFIIDKVLNVWQDAGLIEDGWLFEMARMGPTEAASLLAAGDESALNGVRLLAGLSLNSPS